VRGFLFFFPQLHYYPPPRHHCHHTSPPHHFTATTLTTTTFYTTYTPFHTHTHPSLPQEALAEGLIVTHSCSVDGIPKEERKSKIEAELMRSAPGMLETEANDGLSSREATSSLSRANRVWWPVALGCVLEITGCVCLSVFPAVVFYHEAKHDTSLMAENWEGEDGASWSKVSIIDMVGTFLSVVNWLLCGITSTMTLSNAHLPVLRAVTDGQSKQLQFLPRGNITMTHPSYSAWSILWPLFSVGVVSILYHNRRHDSEDAGGAYTYTSMDSTWSIVQLTASAVVASIVLQRAFVVLRWVSRDRCCNLKNSLFSAYEQQNNRRRGYTPPHQTSGSDGEGSYEFEDNGAGLLGFGPADSEPVDGHQRGSESHERSASSSLNELIGVIR
jgi:hypothetical protein